MQYKVVPFTAYVSRDDTTASVAAQVQKLVDAAVAEGWEFVSMENVETSVAPTSGCFGLGAKPGFTTSFQMLIFKKP